MNGSSLKTMLISGGPDSAVMAYTLAKESQDLRFIFLRHGRLRNTMELKASRIIARNLDIPLDVADLTGIRKVYAGYRRGEEMDLDAEPPVANVIDDDSVPFEELMFQKGLSPFSIMITLALYYTHVVDGIELYIGLIKSQTDMRPRTKEYLEKLSELNMILNPTLPKVVIHAPQIEMSKADVIASGLEMGVPFVDTWSCLYAGEMHCGTCQHCTQRKDAFRELGVEDPVRYAI